MFETITFSRFADAFKSIKPDNFTYNGLKGLYDYLEELEEDCGEKIELDVIAFCCEYAEYSNLAEFQEAYDSGYQTIEDVQNNTTVIDVEGDGFIIQQF